MLIKGDSLIGQYWISLKRTLSIIHYVSRALLDGVWSLCASQALGLFSLLLLASKRIDALPCVVKMQHALRGGEEGYFEASSSENIVRRSDVCLPFPALDLSPLLLGRWCSKYVGGSQYSLRGISTPTKAAAGPLGFSTDLAGLSCFQCPPTCQL